MLLCRDTFPYNWPIVMMAILGKMCITATFAIIYLYSCEIYPTVVRSVGVSSSSVFARVGGAVAPFVGSLDKVNILKASKLQKCVCFGIGTMPRVR